MGLKAMAAVGDRSRATKNELLLLLKIADLADDDGRNCWMETPAMGKWLRADDRSAQRILLRLQAIGEIVIEVNDGRRSVPLGHGRHFCPKWFIHVRCVYDWPAYQAEEGAESDKTPDSANPLPRGRPSRKSDKTPDSAHRSKSGVLSPKSGVLSSKSGVSSAHIRKYPLSTRTSTQEQGSAAARTPRSPSESPGDNLKVITKLVHDILDHFPEPDDLIGLVKESCASLGIAYDTDVIRRAIDSADHQRIRAGKTPSDRHSAGAAAAAS